MVDIQKEEINESYKDVRNDSTSTSWVLLSYDENAIILNSVGTDYSEFLSKLNHDERFFGYVRFTSGDELSKRAKFVLITWIGNNVGPLKRAKVSTDKASVKMIFQSFALEVQTSDLRELEEEHIKKALEKAGGAYYGVGTRD